LVPYAWRSIFVIAVPFLYGQETSQHAAWNSSSTQPRWQANGNTPPVLGEVVTGVIYPIFRLLPASFAAATKFMMELPLSASHTLT
jgi:hypothetical protein